MFAQDTELLWQSPSPSATEAFAKMNEIQQEENQIVAQFSMQMLITIHNLQSKTSSDVFACLPVAAFLVSTCVFC